MTDNFDQFMRHLIENRIKYLVWTERQWPADKIDFSQVQHHINLKELGRWNHPMTGEIILFEIMNLRKGPVFFVCFVQQNPIKGTLSYPDFGRDFPDGLAIKKVARSIGVLFSPSFLSNKAPSRLIINHICLRGIKTFWWGLGTFLSSLLFFLFISELLSMHNERFFEAHKRI